MDAKAGTAAPRPPAAATAAGPTEQQQQRAAKVLAALEKQIGERIDRDFFAEEGSFRPLVNVIDVLGAADGAVNNVSLERLKGQCELATMAMEKFVDENYGCVFWLLVGFLGGWGLGLGGGVLGCVTYKDIYIYPNPRIKLRYLNGNVEAMGKVLRRFHETSDDVQRLRRQVR